MTPTTRKILDLNAQGVRPSEIARQAGCTRGNVTITLRRHLGWSGFVSKLSREANDKLLRLAENANVPPRELARDLLTKIIEEEYRVRRSKRHFS